ncbi:hypothetical protein Ahy_B04g073348 [Arachis hypogaea]|uniref:Uncharacterized protein n=1 Tax=Arachis hypogaea TaxID=3818 RepID=A0A444ZQ75_ARAHY|nr:hypothetical protein Ahy_B04g073348 [Arachis hypogaea]
MDESFYSTTHVLNEISVQLSKQNWNCRGAGSKAFPSIIRDLRQEYGANLFFLLETHISGARGKQVRDKMGFDKAFVVDAVGHAGGIWCLWDSAVWRVDILNHDRQFIHLKISDASSNSTPWLITAVYGSPQRITRRTLWATIKAYASSVNLPWCLLGDFNAMLHDHEKRGGARYNHQSACKEFQECVSTSGLIDLGYSGWPFTWKRGTLAERLDRGFSNVDWQIAFPEACVKHLPMLNVKTAYQSLMSNQDSPNKMFKLVWCWQGPERIRTFLWLVVHNVILTNLERKRRHLTTDDTCPRCRNQDESTIHVLRDCFYAKSIWRLLNPPDSSRSFYSTGLEAWLLQNLTSDNNWACTFGVAVSSLWYFRNKLVFQGDLVPTTTASHQIRARSEEFLKAAKKDLNPRSTQAASECLVGWSRPDEDYVKLNVDGSWFSQRSNAACGGVFRDSAGRFLKGFSCNLGNCSIMHAELWAIIHGLNTATMNGYLNMVVESDSAAAIKFINHGCPPAHPCAPLIQDIRTLALRFQHITWNHALREANSVADLLAKKGQDLALGLHLFDKAPPDISYALLGDSLGTLRIRGS